MARTGRLAGKRVLLTGTGGGQGQAAQALFVREGARVVGCDVQPGRAETTAGALAAEGHDVWGTTVDLTDPHAAASWVTDGATASAASTCCTTTPRDSASHPLAK
jgi:NAD(P)-dependent dehydrogenase (short-subunit alcohol dehydrogenase family)